MPGNEAFRIAGKSRWLSRSTQSSQRISHTDSTSFSGLHQELGCIFASPCCTSHDIGYHQKADSEARQTHRGHIMLDAPPGHNSNNAMGAALAPYAFHHYKFESICMLCNREQAQGTCSTNLSAAKPHHHIRKDTGSNKRHSEVHPGPTFWLYQMCCKDMPCAESTAMVIPLYRQEDSSAIGSRIFA